MKQNRLTPEDDFMRHVQTQTLFLDKQSRSTANRLARVVQRIDQAKSDKSKAEAQRKLFEMEDELLTACHRDPEMWNVVKALKTRFHY